jgi:transposase
LAWDEFAFMKGKMSFVAQDFDTNRIITILDGRTEATIKQFFYRFSFYGYEKTFKSIDKLEQAITDYIFYYNNKRIKATPNA